MLSFIEWLSNQNSDFHEWLVFFEAERKLADEDFRDRHYQGLENERIVRFNLRKQNPPIIMTKHSLYGDKTRKVDGILEDGTWIQIKSRESGGNDCPFVLLYHHDRNRDILEQLENENQKGRDWKGQAKVYYLLTIDKDQIFKLDAAKLKSAVEEAVLEWSADPRYNGTLQERKWFHATNGVSIQAAVDESKDAISRETVMAYIPTDIAFLAEYKADPFVNRTPVPNVVDKDGFKPEERPRFTAAEMAIIEKMEADGSVVVPIPMIKAKEKFKDIKDFAKKMGYQLTYKDEDLYAKSEEQMRKSKVSPKTLSPVLRGLMGIPNSVTLTA